LTSGEARPAAAGFRPSAVLFDCDGTLVDSERLANEVLAECLALQGCAIGVDELWRRFRGARMSGMLATLERERGLRLPAQFTAEFRERVAEALSARLQAIDGAAELLAAVRLPRAVVTNGPRQQVDLSLRVTGLAPYFGDRVVSAYEVGSWKPDPQIYLHAAKRLGVEPAECLVVEDADPGIAAALAAGMTVYAYCPPGHPAPGVAPTRTIPHLSALRDLVG